MDNKTSDLILELEMEREQLLKSISHVLPNSNMLYTACKRICEIFDTIYCLTADTNEIVDIRDNSDFHC